MKTVTVHLLCGVPGSGKTFIADQFTDKFACVSHDDYPVPAYKKAIVDMAVRSEKPVLADCPFRMSVLKEELEAAGLKVEWYFIKEPAELIKSRYEKREGKPIPKQHLTNYHRLLNTQRNWNVGSQSEIIQMLKSV